MKTNFVFIMTDSQGANMIGCYGRPELKTPNIDNLAAEGIRFENAYTNCPLCTPARSAIFSGLMPSVNGAHSNNLCMGSNIPHMGTRFRDNGYNTAFIGKWHLAGLDYYDSGVCPDGWDERYWYDGRRYLEDLTEEQRPQWRRRMLPDDFREHATWGHKVTGKSIDFLKEQQKRDEPFLLVCSYDEPHGPFGQPDCLNDDPNTEWNVSCLFPVSFATPLVSRIIA